MNYDIGDLKAEKADRIDLINTKKDIEAKFVTMKYFQEGRNELNIADKKSGIENQKTLGILTNHMTKFGSYKDSIKGQLDKIC